ncbi:MAG: hypothetical protein K2N15_01690 [Lachnospiraceae bacterium]|nr:hypothetical protein [Lachnospiraceae bacterium]
MNINLHGTAFNNDIYANRRRIIINTLLGGSGIKGKKMRDEFLPTYDKNLVYKSEIYTSNMGKKIKYISRDLLSIINNDISQVIQSGDIFECAGETFTAEQIPEINPNNLKEIKAEKNILNFGKNQYFKYISKNGEEHSLYTDNNLIGSIYSEIMRGAPYDRELERYARFWNYLMKSKDPIYISLEYSRDEMKNYLDEAGIEPGFFTIKMGDKENTHFYSTGKNSVLVYSKGRYDERYKKMTEKGSTFFRNYEPGDVWKIGGKEYTLSDDYTLNIPYGEDIYDVEAPSNYRAGVRIN